MTTIAQCGERERERQRERETETETDRDRQRQTERVMKEVVCGSSLETAGDVNTCDVMLVWPSKVMFAISSVSTWCLCFCI